MLDSCTLPASLLLSLHLRHLPPPLQMIKGGRLRWDCLSPSFLPPGERRSEGRAVYPHTLLLITIPIRRLGACDVLENSTESPPCARPHRRRPRPTRKAFPQASVAYLCVNNRPLSSLFALIASRTDSTLEAHIVPLQRAQLPPPLPPRHALL